MYNTVTHGDAIEELRKLPDRSIDLCITDPPYQFISNNTNGGGFMSNGNKKHLDSIKDSFGLNYNPAMFLNELRRVMKFMNLYIFTNKNLLVEYLSFAREHKYSFDILKWLKPNPVPVNNGHYLIDTEYIVLMRERGSVFNSKLGYENYFTYFSHPIGRAGKVSSHPTEKPLDPITRMVRISSNVGDVVLDPYCGSGTILDAAKKMERQYIGVDNTKEWVEFSMQRLKQ